MLQDLINFDAEADKVFKCGLFWRDSLDCSTWMVLEATVRYMFLILTLQ